MTTFTIGNSRPKIQERSQAGQVGWTWPLATLVIRLALFAAFQALIALFFPCKARLLPGQPLLPGGR